MRARHLVEELTPPGWQHEQVYFVCKALFKIEETYRNQNAPKFSKGKWNDAPTAALTCLISGCDTF
jgi:hypothetical protein